MYWEIVLILFILLFMVIYRRSSGEKFYKYISRSVLNIYDKYAATPSYGTETTVTINWNSLNMASNNASADENFNRLVETIIPSE